MHRLEKLYSNKNWWSECNRSTWVYLESKLSETRKYKNAKYNFVDKKAHIATQTASGCTECGYKETEICQELDGNKDFNYIYKLYFYIKNILNQNVKYLH